MYGTKKDGTIKDCSILKENEQLKAQVEQLSNDNHVLKTSFITQQEQIEKMKCCGNCSKSCFAQDCEDIVNRCDYATNDSLLFKCGEWELAE